MVWLACCLQTHPDILPLSFLDVFVREYLCVGELFREGHSLDCKLCAVAKHQNSFAI